MKPDDDSNLSGERVAKTAPLRRAVSHRRSGRISMTTARLHHTLPQAYLSAFTDKGNKEGKLHVLDVESGYSFRTSPKNVAAERDFNRVDIEGCPLDAAEQAFALFEEPAVEAIRKVLVSEVFPCNEDCNLILNFLAFIAIHNPHLRNTFNRAREKELHLICSLLVSDKKLFDTHLRRAREDGHVPDTRLSFENVKKFVEDRRYRIEFSPGDNLRTELKAFDKVLPLLGQRTWSLLIAPGGGPEFICSDHPVTIVWKDARNAPVGYGLKETEVFFPLGRRAGFYGTFEDPLPPVVHLRPVHVATMNTRVVMNAKRHIFSTLKSFKIKYRGEVVEVQCERNNAFNTKDRKKNRMIKKFFISFFYFRRAARFKR